MTSRQYDEIMTEAEQIYRHQDEIGNAYAMHLAVEAAIKRMGLKIPDVKVPDWHQLAVSKKEANEIMDKVFKKGL